MNKKHDKEKVLKSGLKLFCSKGYGNLGMDEICKTTGMTKGAFYHAFKSKENFLLEAIAAYGKSTVVYLNFKLNEKNKKAIDRLQDFYDGMFIHQPKIKYMGCMINNMMSELGGVNRLVGEATSAEFAHFIETIEPCVTEAQKDGDLNPAIDPKSITELLHSTFYGALTRAKSLQDFTRGKATMRLLINSLTKYQ